MHVIIQHPLIKGHILSCAQLVKENKNVFCIQLNIWCIRNLTGVVSGHKRVAMSSSKTRGFSVTLISMCMS